jgi:hypothetical protein
MRPWPDSINDAGHNSSDAMIVSHIFDLRTIGPKLLNAPSAPSRFAEDTAPQGLQALRRNSGHQELLDVSRGTDRIEVWYINIRFCIWDTEKSGRPVNRSDQSRISMDGVPA